MPPPKPTKKEARKQCPLLKDAKEPLKKPAQKAPKRPNLYIVNYCPEKKLWILNQEHRYYHQIQSQIYFTKRKHGHLFIWTPQTSEYFKIEKNPDWGKNIDKLIDFYVNRFIPFGLKNPELIPPM